MRFSKSLFQGGELVVDHRVSPGLTEEQARQMGYSHSLNQLKEGKLFICDAYGCPHCGGVFHKNQLKNDRPHFFLQPHFINDTFIPAWTIVTEGVEIPFGWVPTLVVDPLNPAAVDAFYAAGPRPGWVGPNYDWQGWQRITTKRPAAILSSVTHWIQVSPGVFKLTGLGAAKPSIGA